MNLLIIEKDRIFSESMSNYLGSQLVTCNMATSYFSAKDALKFSSYSCMILDWRLLKDSVADPAEELKGLCRETGVLITSSENNFDDKIESLKSGADDFMLKPFDLAELEARVSAIIRRKSFGGKEQIILGNLTLDLQYKSLSFGDKKIAITRTEYKIFLFLAGHQNRIITQSDLQGFLNGNNICDKENSIYSHIKNIRKKLAKAGCPGYIRTVYGVGYTFGTGE